MDRKVILMVDDEKDFCRITKMNLEASGEYEVLTAFDGLEAVKLAKKAKPDLILMDIMLPKMDGLEALKKLKEDFDTMAIPVIMLTAKDDDLSRLKATWYYDKEYIVKPIEISQLKEKIANALKR